VTQVSPTAGAAGQLGVAPAAGSGGAAAGAAASGAGATAGASTGAGVAGSAGAGPVRPLGAAGAAGQLGAAGTAPTPATTGPVAKHGALRVSGNRVLDAQGEPLQLRGMSLFWSQWTSYYAANTVDQLVDDWRVSLVRAAMGVEETDGFLESPAANEAKVLAVVDRAIERGVYVIIDWHDHHAHEHQAAAVEFFTRMARKYGSQPGVIFEIYNEPLKIEWASVKSYAQAVISAIRATGAKNLVIVGTPNWSQDVDAAAANPIRDQQDVAYTLHFYAATHKQYLRDKAKTALDAGVALFVTEWGTCESTGDGRVDEAETKTWLDFLASHHISWANWALNDKAEACSALSPDAGLTGPWSGGAITPSGALVKRSIP